MMTMILICHRPHLAFFEALPAAKSVAEFEALLPCNLDPASLG